MLSCRVKKIKRSRFGTAGDSERFFFPPATFRAPPARNPAPPAPSQALAVHVNVSCAVSLFVMAPPVVPGTLCFLFFFLTVAYSAPFTAGSIVAVAAATGSALIKEFSSAGALIQTITVPSCNLVNGPDSSMSPDGFVSLSPDGSTACFQCYLSTSSVAVLFGFDGTFDSSTSTTVLVPGTSKGGCASDGGNNIWMFGAGSAASSTVALYLTKGATGGTPLATKALVGNANIRFGAVYDSSLLLFAYGAGLYSLNSGSGLPTSPSPTISLQTPAISGNNFFFFNATRIIRGVHSGNGCSINFLDFVNCTWAVSFSKVVSGASFGPYWACFNIAGQYESGTFYIYAMSPNTIVKINTATWTTSSLVTSGGNAFKGMVTAPVSAPSASPAPGTAVSQRLLACVAGSACPSASASRTSSPTRTPTVSTCPPSFYCFSGAPVLCPAGFYCPLGSVNATECPKGSYSNAGASTCAPCPAGSFASSARSKLCQQCPGGHYCPVGTSLWARLNCGRGNYCPDGSGAPTPCPYQVPPTGGWGALQVQGPAFLVETASCLNHCFLNFTSGDGMLSKC